MSKLILASASPRRQQLLSQAGFCFETMSPNVDESVDRSVSPIETVKILATRKAGAAFKSIPESEDVIIIAADTLVYLKGCRFGKPVNAEDAFHMLKLLQGQRHEVYTGLTVLQRKNNSLKSIITWDLTTVQMRPLMDDEIHSYIRTGEPMDKAGAYGIQGKGAMLIQKISGDYFNVVGLPMAKLYSAMKELNITLSSIWQNTIHEN